MPKMTTEQFLSHLGIEVGKPFMCGEEKFTVEMKTYSNGTPNAFVCNGDGIYAELSYLFDEEIKPLPKYTLSEDEKAIVRLEFRGENICVYRYASGRLSVKVDGNDIIDLDDDLFPFIEYEDFVVIYELRKCL